MDTIMSTAIMQLLTRIVRSLSERSRATGTAQVSAGAPLATRLMVLVAALGLAGAGVAQAQTNDLRIKSSSFQLDINGAPNALAQVAYRKGIDDVHLSLELQMSWECEQEFVPLGGGPIGFWRCKPRPDFELEIELVAIPNVCKTVFCLDDPARHFPIATVPVDGATEIQDRPPPLPEIVIAPLNTTNKKTYEVILTDLPGLHEFAAQRYIDDHYFEIRARAFSDVPNLETNPNNNQARHERDFLPFNGRFAFGPTDTALRTLGTVVENQAVCGLSDVADSNSQPLLQFFSNTTVLWQPSPNTLDWPAQVVALDDNPACARPVKQGDGLDLLAETDQIVGDLQAQRGGFDVTLLNNVLDATTGAAPSALQLNLPPGHSYHGDDPVEPGPVPRGSSVMILPVSMSGDDYDTIGSTVNAGWLQSEGLPWSFRIDTLKLDKSAFAGTYGEVHYLHDRFYNPWDRRRLSVDGPTSNDRRFSRPESMANQADPSMLLTPSGLEVPSIAMRGVQRGITHFPRTMVEGWKESVAHVAGGRFEADELGPADQYGFELSTDCASCDSGGSEVDYVLKPEINEGLGTDGAYIVRVNNLENPEWGPFVLELNGVIDNSAPNYVIQLNDGWTYSQSQGFTQVYALYDKRRIFERDGDITKSGVLFYPGGIVRGSAGKTNTRVTDYLLGMRRASDQGGHLRPTTHYALTANQARRGNFFMAGLTVGPEVYSNAAEKQPEVGLGSNLDDTLMTIGFGGTTDPDFQTLGSRVGTKYVARQGGITGAFNFDSLPTPKVYEYKLDLIRFAFRQVNNVLDEYSWIDGEISVPGKGDFQVAFESLNLQCSGDVGKGIVTREQCDNIDNNSIFGIDENCDEVMGAWLAPMELQSLAFVAKDPSLPACDAQGRDLEIGNTAQFRAFNQPIGILSRWSPQGNPFQTTITGATDQVLDQPKSNAGVPDSAEPGFDVALNSQVELKTPNNGLQNGYLQTDADMGLPFWNALDLDLRVANKKVGASYLQEQSVVWKQGTTLAGNQDNQTNSVLATKMNDDGIPDADRVKAAYEWGSTGFGFELPIFFDRNRHSDGKRPQFLGKTLSADLLVLEANAGVNFVDPKQTAVSFGASADFDKLVEFDLNLDLSDPSNVAAIDDFICNDLPFSINCSPTPPVQKLVGGIKSSLSVLNQVTGPGLDAFMEAGVREALSSFPPNADPFRNAADAMGKVQSLPEFFASEVEDGLNSITSAIINPLSDDLDAALQSVYDAASADLFDALNGAPDPVRLQIHIDVLDQVIAQLDNVDTALTAAHAAVTQTKTRVDVLADSMLGVNGDINKAKNALSALQSVIASAGNLASCNFDKDTGSSNAVLARIFEVLERIRDVRDALQTVRQANELVQFGTAIAQAAGVNLTAISEAQQTLGVLVEEASTQVNVALNQVDAICGTVGAQVGNVLNDANQLIADVTTALNTIESKINTVRVQVKSALDTADDAIGAGVAVVDEVRNGLGQVRLVIEEARDGVFTSLTGMTSIVDIKTDVFDAALQSVSFVYPADALGPKRSIVKQLALVLTDPIDQAIAQSVAIANAQLQSLTAFVPHPSAAELRELVVDAIMNSPAVESIHTVVYMATDEVSDLLNDIVLDVLDQVAFVLKDLAQQLENQVNAALDAATAAFKDQIPINAAKLDGYALIEGDELMRLHLGAEFTQDGDDEENTTSYGAALDVVSWNANNKALNCLGGNTSGLLDASISVYGVPISVGVSDATLQELTLGITIENLKPVGVNGMIIIDGEIDFQAFQIYDIAFAAGVGKYENYLGASGAGKFDSVMMFVAFLIGKTCNTDVLLVLDPEASKWVTFPGGIFNGGYVRGGASIPIWDNGCFLRVGAYASAGAWLLIGPPFTVGGVVSGGAWGKALCIASLKGQVTVWGEKSGDVFTFGGEGWGAAGLGFCDPEGWSSIPKVRDDDWCGTGDAKFSASYKTGKGFSIGGLKTSAID